MKTIQGLMIAGVAAILLVGYSDSCYAEARSVSIDKKLIKKAHSSVKLSLKDPDSAKFKNEYVVSERSDDGGTQVVVCGLVNAKNSYGGYAGFERYMYVVSTDYADLESANSESGKGYFDALFELICLGKK